MTLWALDETDRGIIEALWSDARQSFQTIADHLGVSEGTIRTRIKRLERDGVIRVSVVLNVADLETRAIAFLWISCDRALLRDIANVLSSQPTTRYVASLLGRADLMAIASQESPAAMVRFVDETVRTLPGVTEVRVQPILHMVKTDVRWGRILPASP